MMKNKLISICIPTYNGGRYLEEALNSIENQTYENIEVILSDDNSSDDTLKIAHIYKQRSRFPVHIYSHTPAGIGANWNHSIKKASGEWIKILFQDDCLEHNCIERMLSVLLENNLQIVVSERTIIDENSQEITSGNWFDNFKNLIEPAGIAPQPLYILKRKNLRLLQYERYSEDNIIGEPCASMFSKDLYRNVGPFDKNLKQILDYEYWLRVLLKYDIGIIGEKLVRFRVHSEQTSNINYNNQVREAGLILDFIHKNFIWDIDRKSRMAYFHKKYPILYTIAKFKNKIINS